jgi:hypothetical protein
VLLKESDRSGRFDNFNDFVNTLSPFQQALMSFEEEKLAEALKVLQETEKRCEVSDGFVKSVKRKFTKKKKPVSMIQ